MLTEACLLVGSELGRGKKGAVRELKSLGRKL